MTPDDYLGPRVRTTVRFESGLNCEVTARLRRGIGFTDETVIAFRPVDGRGLSAVKVRSLRLFASTPELFDDFGMNPFFLLTKEDVEAIMVWLDGLSEGGGGEWEVASDTP